MRGSLPGAPTVNTGRGGAINMMGLLIVNDFAANLLYLLLCTSCVDVTLERFLVLVGPFVSDRVLAICSDVCQRFSSFFVAEGG